jgi:biotin carboxyl carrier protein
MSEVFNFDDGTQRFEVRLRRDEQNTFYAVIKGTDGEEKEIKVNAKILGAGQFQFTLENSTYKCSVSKDGNIRFIHLDGEDYELKRVPDLVSEFGESEDIAIAEGNLSSPMPGRIVKIFVKIGELVKKGQDLLVVEAMKMENKISAPFTGRIREVYYSEGDQIEANVSLIVIEEETNVKEKD